MNPIPNIEISIALLIWLLVILVCLGIAILLLTWLLVKREKALQLLGFSISPTGLKLTYELNRDEKLQQLALDNTALQKEIEALKAKNRKQRWQSFKLLFIVFLIYLIDKWRRKKGK